MKYFISDCHFLSDFKFKVEWQRNIFKDARDYANNLIKNINSVVKPDDTLYCVGDWFNYCSVEQESWKEAGKVVKQINCKVILIMGNNEQRIVRREFHNSFHDFKQYCLSLGFEDVLYDLYVTIRGLRFYLVHNPKDAKIGVMNLFGHVHSSSRFSPIGINVYQDFNNHIPISEDDIYMMIYTANRFYLIDAGFKAIFGDSTFPTTLWSTYSSKYTEFEEG